MNPTDALDAALEELKRLRASEAGYRLLLDESTDPIFHISPQGQYLYVNREFASGVGLAPEQIIGRSIGDVFPPEEAAKRMAVVRWVCENAQPKVFEVRVPRPTADRYYITSVKPIFGSPGQVTSIVCISKEITERKEFEQRLTELANLDFLTGIANRRHFLELAEQELARVRRYGTPLALAMMDIDHFKSVNDRYGHQAGDQVLRQVVDVCRHALRETDVMGRIGGEEFAILLPETEASSAREVADRLRAEVARAAITLEEGPTLRVTVSLGIAPIGDGDPNLGALLRRADQSLYQAKLSGRDRVMVSS